jgi:hypothetical protein
MIPPVVVGKRVPVIRTLTAAILALVACTGLAAARADAAAETQLLSVDLSGPSPRIERIDRYDTQQPIRVRVFDPTAQRVGLQGVAPDGSTLDLLLARGEDGFYSGTFWLRVPGDWSLAFDTTSGDEDALTEHFTVAAADYPPPGEAAVMLVLSGASICSGIGLIAVGRRASLQPPLRG